ncbi:hypothetical protein Sjap_000221 [Stephania japonica]|uniref:E3 ubiquitin-protein ligase RMA n=1 Tax=Stephania japonica TaxID=461633 RepID=A0AAP0PTT7_9MAGN
MATEQYFEEGMVQDEAEDDQSPPKGWKSALAAALASDGSSACFDCNICLENAQDPVVTLCGHLYCWPCIYKWLHFQSTSNYPDEDQQCPVCKAVISQSTLVPLYGRGQSALPNDYKGKSSLGLEIPRRPQACGLHAAITSTSTSSAPPLTPHVRRHPYQAQPQHQQFYNGYASSPSPTIPSSLHPMVGMFGDLVYGRVFGNSSPSLYYYPSPYHNSTSSTPRVRRQEMQADKSLNRISMFLLCCVVLCLFLF